MVSYAEKDDDYVFVVAQDGERRLIACADAIQWIVQVKRGGRWFSRHFCRSKVGLLHCWGDDVIVAKLPDWFPEADYPETASQLGWKAYRGGKPVGQRSSGVPGGREGVVHVSSSRGVSPEAS